MAITAVGFDGTITESEWASFMRHQGTVADRHGVSGNGLVVSAAGGTRTVSVSAGTAVLPGLRITSDAATSLTFAANSGSNNRVDAVVVEGNWSTNAVSIKVVQGSSAVPPALTQSEGVLWQMPLAYVTITPSLTTMLAANIVSTVPYPRRRYSAAAKASGNTTFSATTPVDIAGLTLNVPVPDTEAVFIVQATLDLMLNTNTLPATFTGRLLVGGTVQQSAIVAAFHDSGNPAQGHRATLSQTWRVTGVAPGVKIFKMDGATSLADGAYVSFATNSTMTIFQAF